MPALAGEPRRIASSGSLGQSRPVWSASGDRLACVSESPSSPDSAVEIVSVVTGASQRVALPGDGRRFDLSWSPGDRLFAFVSTPAGLDADVAQLWVARASDGKGVPVTDGRTNVRGPTWSPDGRWLYYVANHDGGMDVWRRQIAGDSPVGSPQRVTTGMDVRQWAWAADGTKVTYSKGRRVANVWRVPILTDRPATWADAVQVTSDQAFIEFVDVSTDGRRLLVSSDRGGNQDIWMLAAGGGAMQQLTTDPTPDWDPRWSPDSSQIAFYSYRSGNRDIWTMPANGGAARQLTSDPGPDLQPTWSPDGTQIAFLCGRADGSHTCVVPARGGRTRDLGRGIDAEWARDSSSLIVQMIGQDGPSHSLWRVRLDGSSLEPITAGPANRPRRSRDGADVYYVGARERAGNIWSASLGRRLERPLTQFAARRGRLENALSTDGRSLYFIWEEDLGDIWVMDVRNPGAR
jgi:Tol biopolymer transport system component